MAHSKAIYIFILITLLSGISSCNLPLSTPVPIATQTNTPVPSSTPTLLPTIQPTIASSPTPSDTAAATPVGLSLYLPNGIATYPTGGGKVQYYDFQGQLLGEAQAPNLESQPFQRAAIAGVLTYSPGPLLPPLVYYVFENGGELWLSSDNNTSLLKASPNLLNLIGVPGKSIMAYTLLEYSDAGLISRLFLGELQTLPTADPILVNTNTEIYAIKPLAISLNNGQAVGVWYTTVPYGIGGDIVFEPRKTLNYLDSTNNQITTYLNMSKGPAGISDDQTWVAYTPVDGNGPMSIVHNFDFSTSITFPLRDDSNRGSGEAVFSPDNQYVAWREAGGSIADQPSTFHETIRIATLDGNILTEVSDTSLINISGFPEIGWVVPVGWLDAQTLVLEVRASNWDTACIISVKFDGSGLAYIAPGSLVGFLYP